MKQTGCILVVARSGRMLAQQLTAIGYTVLVIDCFADLDMQQVALDWRCVKDLSLPGVQSMTEALAACYTISGVIYGSGLEAHLDTLSFLASRYSLLGNSPETLQALQQKRDFFSVLDALYIPHPAVQFTPPEPKNTWLFKPGQHEGGVGICWADAKGCAVQAGYWQQYLPARPMSVLFLANRHQVTLIGFQHQLFVSHGRQPFLFAGVVNEPEFPALLMQQIVQVVSQLTRHYNLCGVNSIDFLCGETAFWLLEINARPSASLQLYEAGLMQAHIAACLGKSCEISYNKRLFSAYKIIYAENCGRIKKTVRWPDWAMDRPPAGTRLGPGEPVCSLVETKQTDKATIITRLATKQRQLLNHMIDRN